MSVGMVSNIEYRQNYEWHFDRMNVLMDTLVGMRKVLFSFYIFPTISPYNLNRVAGKASLLSFIS